MTDLLVELFSEEIPARLQAKAASDLARLMCGKLDEAGLKGAAAESFYGPRRLVLSIEGLPDRSPDVSDERKGPRVGAPDKAVEGFLRAAGLSHISEAEIRDDKKGQFYVARIESPGRAASDVIADALRSTIDEFPWPKAQRWGDGDLKWVRPLRRILLSFGGEPVPFRLENGSQILEAGLLTEGHRVLSGGTIEVSSFAAYEKSLNEAFVVLRGEERSSLILENAQAVCREAGLELVEDKGLLNEVVGLAEWPQVLLGSFDEKFLQLPDEVITAAMRGHQKYFSVRDPSTGRLAPSFVAVADIPGGEGMLAGYERVLTARLSDALFLYKNDLTKPLEQHAEKLKGVTFFDRLGTIADKVERVSAMAVALARPCGADTRQAQIVAEICKADLATDMVYEFPELQGLMGRYYALHEGADPAIADAIRDHYRPVGMDDQLPDGPLGLSVSLADKIDTLAAFWSIDQKPTGSRDPFALRRAALSVIKVILEKEIRLDLEPHLQHAVFAASALRQHQSIDIEKGPPQLQAVATLIGEEQVKKVIDDRLKEELPVVTKSSLEASLPKVADLLVFFHDRLSVYFRDQGFRHDRVAAALTPGADDFVLVEKRLRALDRFVDTEDGQNLTAAYKRAANILKAEEKKGGLPESGVASDFLEENDEQALYSALLEAEKGAHQRLGDEDFASAMQELSAVRPVIDRFFEAVTVNDENQTLRANRLALLLRFVDVVKLVADFDRLEG
ncbi:MAG: glycine--tRNA ligase subunit beta [Pseudomonadota bacterium]